MQTEHNPSISQVLPHYLFLQAISKETHLLDATLYKVQMGRDASCDGLELPPPTFLLLTDWYCFLSVKSVASSTSYVHVSLCPVPPTPPFSDSSLKKEDCPK